MWLTCSTVGRKLLMAFSGAVLLLFVTFHCCMNSIAICWPATYNSLCEFLGANWYALVASAGLALFILLHIVYASILTIQNRKARGSVGYAVSKKPKAVEWSSKNMYVLGIVILAFLVVHLIQFWAKMQLQEIRGVHDVIPPAAGTLFLQEAFQLDWTWIVYIIGFIALWFHLNHGIWSMFQSVGWDNTVWIARLKKVALCWSTIVCLLFVTQAIVFTVKAHEGYFKNDPVLREQYKEMMVPMFEKDFGPDAAQIGIPDLHALDYETFVAIITDLDRLWAGMPKDVNDPMVINQLQYLRDEEEKQIFLQTVVRRIEEYKNLQSILAFLSYLEGKDLKKQYPPSNPPAQASPEIYQQQAEIEEGVVLPSDTLPVNPESNN